jgi:S1-C subfamily serine protease
MVEPPPSSPWPASLAVPLAPKRPAGRGRRVLTGAVLVLLVLAAGAQAYEMKRLNDRLGRADRAGAAAQAEADAQIGLLKTRAAELENTIAAQLNPISVAAKIAPSVYELDAGDYLGTAWAVRNSAGGTDLITNYHVVAPVYKLGKRAVDLVRGAERLHATVVRVSTANDVALVHVSQSLPVLDVEKAVVPGESVLVEGTPLGWQASVTTGVVSNVERRVRTENGTIVYFQFDAAINPGNSGGPVVDARGRVLGVASAVFIDTENDVPAQSMSLAIPITTACRVLAAC